MHVPSAPLGCQDTLLSQLGHTRACVCTLCTALTGALTEYEALTSLALVVQAEAEHQRTHAPEEGGRWETVWQAYRDATQ